MTTPAPLDGRASIQLIQSRLTLRSANALARAILDLIAAEELPAQSQLPTVRDLAAGLGMSRSAVAQAWKALSSRHVIETRRRGGTFVLGPPQPPRARRYDSMVRTSSTMPIDLGNLRTDDLPPPDLAPALAYALGNRDLHNTFAGPITPELAAAAASYWPFDTNHFLATHGIIDAIELALASVVRPGDRVIIESPSQARVLDILESVGATAIPIEYRPDGPDLDQLRVAMISKPSAMIYQPNGNVPSGRAVDDAWIEAAATLLRDEAFPVFELSQTALMRPVQRSLAGRLPDRVVHMQAYNFFFGADLRVAVVGGAPEYIDMMWLRLTYSSRWVSRLLQFALAFQLTDDVAIRHTKDFVTECKRRHSEFCQALTRCGFDLEPTAGPHIWLPVPDEHSVCTRLSRDGIVVHPGSFFQAGPAVQHHVHINGAALILGIDKMAQTIAEACQMRVTGGAAANTLPTRPS
ncbi:DNA-binding transcriptional regulator, MocR family, contains an aminotransferase domain [Micromonospora viridifaciens]|uniref:DNA-binding transcriptional regulator, MocR family, contains an aminotransferase domain n=1 Tax=Micromonospora viridifaciens TaxID=1881 RepID=A0A1C4WS93_MICVI|nr:PLP-dependent aminotransferase family protein [Micromonospora viridifaciens]SCE99019.1 DNA-binding transcriptional regulator, MocR family, contains an aminotransferase domain [Micromonospora viridifaciens]